MKAIVWTKYGPPEGLEFREVDRPVPKDNEILVKIHATTVTAGDCEMRTLTFPFYLGFFIRFYTGLKRPKRVRILGQELAGEVVDIGGEVLPFDTFGFIEAKWSWGKVNRTSASMFNCRYSYSKAKGYALSPM